MRYCLYIKGCSFQDNHFSKKGIEVVAPEIRDAETLPHPGDAIPFCYMWKKAKCVVTSVIVAPKTYNRILPEVEARLERTGLLRLLLGA